MISGAGFSCHHCKPVYNTVMFVGFHCFRESVQLILLNLLNVENIVIKCLNENKV